VVGTCPALNYHWVNYRVLQNHHRRLTGLLTVVRTSAVRWGCPSGRWTVIVNVSIPVSGGLKFVSIFYLQKLTSFNGLGSAFPHYSTLHLTIMPWALQCPVIQKLSALAVRSENTRQHPSVSGPLWVVQYSTVMGTSWSCDIQYSKLNIIILLWIVQL